MTDLDPTPPGPFRVLLVEDDVALREMACQILVGAGHDVTSAHSAEEAEVLARSELFDVLFTDVVLPGATGIELASLLAGRPPVPAVVFTTGQWDRDVRRAVARSEHPVLRKPYTAQGLLAAVAAAGPAPHTTTGPPA